MKRSHIVTALLLTVLFLCTANSLPASAAGAEKYTPSGIAYSDIGSSIDNYIKEREAGLASCVVSVYDRDGVIFNGYYGYADMENAIAADTTTVYEWASASKLLVWTSVMQQWERGNIDLDADIREYLPENFLTKLQYPDEKITMIDLMSHKAGFQESFYEDQECGEEKLFDTLEDAVRKLQCYQAYHVGEYTAYSNWGCALAAYIVERVSGADYVTYVHENIFEPLGMEHTSIDPRQADNEWVREKRGQLKCYSRYAQEAYNRDYGISKIHVQLYPAGAAIGTLADFSAFGQALVAEDCPLFERSSTREEMFRATSYYGNTDMARNCHGFWTQEYLVETLGHGGNSMCTSNLEFDPVSGLGVAVFTNEPGETAFCNGIPGLLYGHLYDREECRQYTNADTDFSGIYYCKRSITEGAAKANQYTLFLPLKKTGKGTYSVSFLGVKLGNEQEYIPVGEDLYILKDNGRELLIYARDGVYELECQDYVRSSTGLPTVICFGFILFGILCLVILLIKLAAFIIRKIRGNKKAYTTSDKQILVCQTIYGVSGVIFACFILICSALNPAFTAVSGILAALLGLVSVVNGALLCYNTMSASEPEQTQPAQGERRMSIMNEVPENTRKSDTKAFTKIKQYVWAVLGVAYSAFIVTMQLYCFWKL